MSTLLCILMMSFYFISICFHPLLCIWASTSLKGHSIYSDMEKIRVRGYAIAGSIWKYSSTRPLSRGWAHMGLFVFGGDTMVH